MVDENGGQTSEVAIGDSATGAFDDDAARMPEVDESVELFLRGFVFDCLDAPAVFFGRAHDSTENDAAFGLKRGGQNGKNGLHGHNYNKLFRFCA